MYIAVQSLNTDRMNNTEQILAKLRKYKEENADIYGIEVIGLFGSCARGKQFPDSDIDVCIKLKQPNLFNMNSIQEELESLLDSKVDLVSLGAMLRPVFRKNLERDAVYV